MKRPCPRSPLATILLQQTTSSHRFGGTPFRTAYQHMTRLDNICTSTVLRVFCPDCVQPEQIDPSTLPPVVRVTACCGSVQTTSSHSRLALSRPCCWSLFSVSSTLRVISTQHVRAAILSILVLPLSHSNHPPLPLACLARLPTLTCQLGRLSSRWLRSSPRHRTVQAGSSRAGRTSSPCKASRCVSWRMSGRC